MLSRCCARLDAPIGISRHPFFKPELCKPLLIQRHIRDSHELAFRDRRKEQAELGRKRANAAGTGHGLED